MFTPSKNLSFTISLLTLQIIKYIDQDARSFRKTRKNLHDKIDQNMESIQGGNAALHKPAYNSNRPHSKHK